MNFIRERLPRQIPFELIEIRFWILIYICFIYFYSCKFLLYPKAPNIIISKIFELITIPYVNFDSFIKYNDKLFPFYHKKIMNLIFILDTWNYYNRIILIYIMQIIPRIILLLIFLVDVFWLHNISIFYFFIFLSVFPLLYRYFKYSLEQYIQVLELKYDEIWLLQEDYKITDWEPNPKAVYHDKTVSIREYLKIQNEALCWQNTGETDIAYTGMVSAKEKIYEQYKIDNNINKNKELLDEDYEKIHEQYEILMPKILILYNFVEFNKITPTKYYIPQTKVIINLSYLICWLYILFMSFHTLKDFNILLYILEIVNRYSNFEEPFTGLYNLNIKIDKDFIKYCCFKLWDYKIFHLVKIISFAFLLNLLNKK